MLRPTINVKKPVMSQPQVMEIIPPYARPVLNVVVMPAITERIEKEIAKFENNLHSMIMLMFLIICHIEEYLANYIIMEEKLWAGIS